MYARISPRSARSSAAACRSAHSAAGATSWNGWRLLGPVYQAGTLSGNPVAMIAGLTTLELLSAPGFPSAAWAPRPLVLMGKLAAAAAVPALHSPPIRSAACSEFSLRPSAMSIATPKSWPAMSSASSASFTACWHEGIYFAPSAFEAGFLSAAHSAADIEATAAAAARVFSSLQTPLARHARLRLVPGRLLARGCDRRAGFLSRI